MPMQIENNKNARLKGSFTAVLNRITDKAPTNPSDKASDDLTTATKDATLIVIINKVLPNEILEENVVENFQYMYLTYNPPMRDITKIVNVS